MFEFEFSPHSWWLPGVGKAATPSARNTSLAIRHLRQYPWPAPRVREGWLPGAVKAATPSARTTSLAIRRLRQYPRIPTPVFARADLARGSIGTIVAGEG